MNFPQSAPGQPLNPLEARLRLGLRNWTKRTFLWGSFFFIFSLRVPFLRYLLAAWIVFSGVSLAFLLLGLKLAKNLQGGAFTFKVGGMPAPHQARPQDEPSPRVASTPGEVIEIDTEVLPPENPVSEGRAAIPRQVHDA